MHKAVGLWNLLSHAGRDVSPLEALTSTRQSVAHLRPIGCRAFVLKNERELGASTTFSERAWAGINLGNVRGGPAYMIYVAELGEIKFSTNVDFAVQAFPFAAPFAAPEETQHPLDDGIYYYDSPPPGFAMDAPPGRAAPAPDGGGGGEPADGDDPVILGWATDDDSSGLVRLRALPLGERRGRHPSAPAGLGAALGAPATAGC